MAAVTWDRWDHGCPDLPDEPPSDELLEDEDVAQGLRDSLTGELLSAEEPPPPAEPDASALVWGGAASRFGEYVGRDFSERPPEDPWSVVARLVLVALLAGVAWIFWVASVALAACSPWTAAGVYVLALVWAWRSDWIGVEVRR